jgi:hypothetical protein
VSTASSVSEVSAENTLPELKCYGRAALSDYFGDFVIYRNLEPLDRRIPGLKAAHYRMGLPDERIPRKLDAEYAKAAVWLAKEGQRARGESIELSELVFVGDTLANDGQAYANMIEFSEWEGSCAIGRACPNEDLVVDIDEDDAVYCVNRWSALDEWVKWTLDRGLHLDNRTVAVIDIDKTALGAKGRNDHVINEARLEGIYRTMVDVLGDAFDREAFEKEYAELNRARYHFLTADNQDYLAYICLVLNAELVTFQEILDEVDAGSLANFEQFLRWVDSRFKISPGSGESMRQAHEAVMASVRSGDPTPFKHFRRQEFIATVARMGNVADDASVETMLAEEITLTNEVAELSAWLAERGCLLICLSDKPDEASVPDRRVSPDLPPVHRAQTHLVGTSIRSALDELD